MKKRTFIISMLCLTLIGGSINVLQAQETKQEQQQPEKKKSKLGSFVRKVGEATTGINMSNETFAVIPFDAQKLISMEVVSCTGNINTGQVLLTLAVKAKQEGVKPIWENPVAMEIKNVLLGMTSKAQPLKGLKSALSQK